MRKKIFKKNFQNKLQTLKTEILIFPNISRFKNLANKKKEFEFLT